MLMTQVKIGSKVWQQYQMIRSKSTIFLGGGVTAEVANRARFQFFDMYF